MEVMPLTAILLAIYAFLSSFSNKKFITYETVILHSKGVGILSLDGCDLNISKCLLAYNCVNCINFVQDTSDTTFSVSLTQTKFGQINSDSFEFASGLNILVTVSKKIHNITLTNITLTNNVGT